MRSLLLLAGLSLVFLIAPGAVWAQEGAAEAASIAVILTPLVAAATAVERILEMIFNTIESAGRSLGSFLGIGGDYLKLARQEVTQRRDAVQKLLAKDSEDRSDDRLSLAEDALAAAEDRVVDYFKSPAYTGLKSTWSLLLGIVIGLVVAVSLKLGILEMLGVIETGFLGDWILTGLVIGTGSAPVHSLIGLLQNTKDAVDKARALWGGKAVAEIEGVLQRVEAERAALAAAATAGGGSAAPAPGLMAMREVQVDGDVPEEPAPAAEAPAAPAKKMSSVHLSRHSRRILS